MAITIDQTSSLPITATGNDTAPTLSLTNTQAGSGVVIALGWDNNSALLAFTVGGVAATLVGSGYFNATLSSKVQFAYLPNLGSGGTKAVVGVLGTGGFWSMYACSLAGSDTATFFDAVNGATGTTTNPTVSVTTTSDGCAIFSIVSNNGAESTAGSGFTIISVPDFNQFDEGEYDLDVGATGAKTVNYVNASSNQWAITGCAFKAAGGGGGGRTTRNTRSAPLGVEVGMGFRMRSRIYVPAQLAAA